MVAIICNCNSCTSTYDNTATNSISPSMSTTCNCTCNHTLRGHRSLAITNYESEEQRQRRLKRQRYLRRRAERAELWSAVVEQWRFLCRLFPWEMRLRVWRQPEPMRPLVRRCLLRATRPGRMNVSRSQMRFGRRRGRSRRAGSCRSRSSASR